MSDLITIPNRFESLQAAFGGEIKPLIVSNEDDLQAFIRMREQARVQNGGLLTFLLGTSGVGKTTSVHSASINLPDVFAPVLTVLPEIAYREAAAWIDNNLPPSSSKATLVLFDGREVSDDEVGLRQFLSSLNQILRRRPDVVFCWPTTDSSWHEKIRDIARTIGGQNFAPAEGDHNIQGPPPGEWPNVLERLLIQFGKTYDDIGVASDLVGEVCAQSSTVGDFLTKIGSIIADRISKVRATRRLPKLLFVVTSSGDVSGEANRIRRAGNQILAPEPLLGHSPRSEVGKWWAERNKNPNHHLGYIISLFEARLVTMTASAVVYACLHHGEEDLRTVAQSFGTRPDKGNAGRTMKVTDLYRLLAKEPIPEFTSSRKSSAQEPTVQAYSAIQGLSAKRHKSINQALCALAKENLASVDFAPSDFEKSYSGELVTDAVITSSGEEIHLEFHHLSEVHCRAASMASYIMEKLRSYAWYHQLIPR